MRARAHLWAGLATGSPMALRPVGFIWWPVQRSEFENCRSLLGLHTTWHREGFHSIAAGAIIALALLAPVALFVGIRAAGPPAGAFFLAWLSHLAADETNPSGCMLLWPFSSRQVL